MINDTYVMFSRPLGMARHVTANIGRKPTGRGDPTGANINPEIGKHNFDDIMAWTAAIMKSKS